MSSFISLCLHVPYVNVDKMAINGHINRQLFKKRITVITFSSIN